jgi:formylglycine-generating enzyme required for sulfatase activity/C1A family cysteine protease
MKLALILAMLMFCRTDAFAVMKGDIDNSGGIDLRDVVLAIQVCAGMTAAGVKTEADVNADGKIGLADTLFAAQFAAGKMKLWYKDTDGDRVSDGTSVFAVERPAAYWYEETELFGIYGDPDDSDSNVFGAVAPEIAIVESFIQKSGANWVAEVNPISLLPDEQRVMLLGALLPDAEDETRIKKYFSKRQHRTLPSSFDWQNGNFVTPVRNQGITCGSCWAFAATAALESQVLRAGGSSVSDLSEQIVLSCSDAGTCAGGYIDDASDFLRNIGTNTETCYSYKTANGNCGNACADWQNNASRIDSWDYVSWGEAAIISEIKNAIYENGPLVSVLYIYEDFFFYRSGVYSYAWGKQKGGHAVVITGWDDATSSFTVKNSWGTSWGESGYFRIAYSELAGRTQFGTWTIAYHSGNCTYSISPVSNSFSSTAGTGSVSVTAQSGCNWTADSSATWITLISGSNGGGSGTVSYSVASNSGTSSRTGTVTIAGQTFTVIQSGVTPTTTTVKPTTTTLPTTTTTVKPMTSTTTSTTTTTTIPNGDYTNSLGMSFRLIPAGTFTMGSPENEPGWLSDETQHQVTLTKSFYMQTTEVTQGQWKTVTGSNPSHFLSCGDNCPVEKVSWDDVQSFITSLNGRGEGTYRLPTEAEWEYAARAGTSTPFYFGQCLSTNQGNYDGNYPLTGCSKGEYREEVIPVASLEANAYGLYDMHGNVWEWCQDWYGAYPTGSVTDPGGPGSGSYRVVRGGSWENLATRCRSADRGWLSPATRDHALGFRLVRTQ